MHYFTKHVYGNLASTKTLLCPCISAKSPVLQSSLRTKLCTADSECLLNRPPTILKHPEAGKVPKLCTLCCKSVLQIFCNTRYVWLWQTCVSRRFRILLSMAKFGLETELSSIGQKAVFSYFFGQSDFRQQLDILYIITTRVFFHISYAVHFSSIGRVSMRFLCSCEQD